jgi:hypothetical protein
MSTFETIAYSKNHKMIVARFPDRTVNGRVMCIACGVNWQMHGQPSQKGIEFVDFTEIELVQLLDLDLSDEITAVYIPKESVTTAAGLAPETPATEKHVEVPRVTAVDPEPSLPSTEATTPEEPAKQHAVNESPTDHGSESNSTDEIAVTIAQEPTADPPAPLTPPTPQSDTTSAPKAPKRSTNRARNQQTDAPAENTPTALPSDPRQAAILSLF